MGRQRWVPGPLGTGRPGVLDLIKPLAVPQDQQLLVAHGRQQVLVLQNEIEVISCPAWPTPALMTHRRMCPRSSGGLTQLGLAQLALHTPSPLPKTEERLDACRGSAGDSAVRAAPAACAPRSRPAPRPAPRAAAARATPEATLGGCAVWWMTASGRAPAQGLNPAAAVFTPCHGSAAPGRAGLQRPSPAELAPAEAVQCMEPGQCLTDLPDEVRLQRFPLL